MEIMSFVDMKIDKTMLVSLGAASVVGAAIATNKKEDRKRFLPNGQESDRVAFEILKCLDRRDEYSAGNIVREVLSSLPESLYFELWRTYPQLNIKSQLDLWNAYVELMTNAENGDKQSQNGILVLTRVLGIMT